MFGDRDGAYQPGQVVWLWSATLHAVAVRQEKLKQTHVVTLRRRQISTEISVTILACGLSGVYASAQCLLLRYLRYILRVVWSCCRALMFPILHADLVVSSAVMNLMCRLCPRWLICFFFLHGHRGTYCMFALLLTVRDTLRCGWQERYRRRWGAFYGVPIHRKRCFHVCLGWGARDHPRRHGREQRSRKEGGCGKRPPEFVDKCM